MDKFERPGQKKGETVFCPLFSRWIWDIRCLEITLARRLYDEVERPGEEVEEHSQTIKETTLNSGRVFPEQLSEVVLVCRFCEEHCLGRDDGPSVIPPTQQLIKRA